jgi:hypothetical protein
VKRGKSRVAEEDVVVQPARMLARAMEDGMETLVQGLSGALKAPADTETTTRLHRVEKVQLEMKQARKLRRKQPRVVMRLYLRYLRGTRDSR